MQKIVVIIFALLCCCRLPSTLASNVTQDGGDGIKLLTLPSEIPDVTDIPTPNDIQNVLNESAHNLTALFYESCNITSCNPVHYKHCYEGKVAQLIIHAVAVLLGIVFAFFGKLK